MSKNTSDNPENVQLTPVEFSPTSTKDAIGSIRGQTLLREWQYPLSLPVGIMLLTLIFSTIRDIATFNKGTANIERADAPSEEALKSASNLTDRIEMFRVALQKLSITDPVSAQIYKEYFPSDKKDASDNQAGAASAPDK